MFCSNCGTKNADGARFCSGCGCALQSVPTQPTQPMAGTPAGGMVTEEEVLESFVTKLGMAEKYKKKYRPRVAPIIRSLMPGEYIELAFVGVTNLSDGGGESSGYALTNHRMIIAVPPNAMATAARRARGRNDFEGVEIIPYNSIRSINYKKTLLLGVITVNLNDGKFDISVDKPFVEKI